MKILISIEEMSQAYTEEILPAQLAQIPQAEDRAVFKVAVDAVFKVLSSSDFMLIRTHVMEYPFTGDVGAGSTKASNQSPSEALTPTPSVKRKPIEIKFAPKEEPKKTETPAPAPVPARRMTPEEWTNTGWKRRGL